GSPGWVGPATEGAASAITAGDRETTPATPSTIAIAASAVRAMRTVFRSGPRLPCPPVPLLAANWKMYKGPRETREFCEAFTAPDGVDAVLCPPFVSLQAAVESGQTVFAQNVHWAAEGAYTGEVSAPMLFELGVEGAIVGQPERRRHFGDPDETVARRALAGLGAGLRVIACVGESLEQRESGQMALVLRLQVEALGDAVGEHEGLVIAYEPVWAI